MGTRADFYIGKDRDMKWIGSIGWDGYPDGIPDALLKATTEETFIQEATAHITESKGTTPNRGWPWPWDDSRMTDYAYCFENGKVWASCFGHAFFDPLLPEPEDESPKMDCFPGMSNIKNVTFGEGSGLIVIGVPGSIEEAK